MPFKGAVRDGFYPFNPLNFGFVINHPHAFVTSVNASRDICALSKSSRLPFVSVPCHTSKPLELLHTDV